MDAHIHQMPATWRTAVRQPSTLVVAFALCMIFRRSKLLVKEDRRGLSNAENQGRRSQNILERDCIPFQEKK
jgi:hypothetical protein